MTKSTETSFDPLEKLYDLMGQVLAKALDEFDDKLAKRDAKIAELQARIAEREDKQAANFQKLQADLVKQIRRLTTRLSEQERRHKREIEEFEGQSCADDHLLGKRISITFGLRPS
jgi:rubrerythrin